MVVLEVRPKAVETILFRNEVVAIGAFRCEATTPLFRDSGPCSYHTLGFPRTVTHIRHSDGVSFVGGPDVVVFYNQGQEYVRERISDIDSTDWFVYEDSVLRGAIARFSARDAEAKRPFRFAVAASDAALHLRQRQLVDLAGASACAADPLVIADESFAVLDAALGAAYGRCADEIVSRPMRETVVEAQRLLAAAFRSTWSLAEVARQVGSSPYHLCRAFRRVTGRSIGEYREALRLRAAAWAIREGESDLTALALDLGYWSHSHFTRAFRRHFGVPPSRLRTQMKNGALARAV